MKITKYLILNKNDIKKLIKKINTSQQEMFINRIKKYKKDIKNKKYFFIPFHDKMITVRFENIVNINKSNIDYIIIFTRNFILSVESKNINYLTSIDWKSNCYRITKITPNNRYCINSNFSNFRTFDNGNIKNSLSHYNKEFPKTNII